MPPLDIDEVDAAEGVAESLELSHQISELLHGTGHQVQATVLTELVATYLVGWPRQERAEMLDMLADQIWRLVPVIEGMVHGPEGHPSNDGRG